MPKANSKSRVCSRSPFAAAAGDMLDLLLDLGLDPDDPV
jgi:hypothetical protein